MGAWEFQSYETEAGRGPVDEFLDRLSEEECVRVGLTQRFIEALWPGVSRPHVDLIEKDERIYELRARCKNVQIRILFWPDNDRHKLVALHGFKKKTSRVSPSDVGVAVKRKSDWVRRVNAR